MHWKGRDGNADVVLASVAFPSGARYVWTAWSRGALSNSDYNGLLPAGVVDRTVFASRLSGSNQPLVVFATEGVRAELVRGAATEQVPLEGGGAIVPNAADVTNVRVYDAAGRLIEERAPETGLVPIPES